MDAAPGYRLLRPLYVKPDRFGESRPDNPRTLLRDGVLRAVLEGKRNLAYALIAQRALKTSMPDNVERVVGQRLWSLQDTDGGIWADYRADGTIPHFAKKTNEIAPRTLLEYDRPVWI